MEQITVRMNEWFFTQSLVGYKSILDSYGQNVKTTGDGIIVEKKHLEVLPDAFFQYYLTKYSVADREARYLHRLHKKFKEGSKNVKAELNRRINDTKKKVEKYFKDTNQGKKLIETAELYRKEKEYSPKLDDLLNNFLEMLRTKDIDEKLTSNFYKAVYLSPYFGQVSFLNVSANSKTISEQKEMFRRDFIEPIFNEWNFYNALFLNFGKEESEKILEESLRSLPLKKGKKKTIGEWREYVQKEIHKCSLTDFPIALRSFEESVFSPLSLSMKNAINVTWDSNGKEYIPISSLARLLVFCAQAGATMSQGRSVFIHYGGTFEEIYQTNRSYANLKNPDKTFDEIVFDLVREQKMKANYIANHYMIYEYESDYQSKKTLLNYMIMTPDLMRLFENDSDLFLGMHYTNRSTMIRLLMQRHDTKIFISSILRDKIQNSYSPFEVIRMVQVRHLHQSYLKEGENLDTKKQKKYVWALVKSAEEVKKTIGEKKSQGIAYRLLNAVRSNDKNTFMDTVMRTYISCEKQMPGLLLEALHENEMDFATVGNAWIAGLVSKPNDVKGDDSNE